tara:strand:- start:400 stop:768 length:369 start_codon:yes stop_codon:yes gene_type:complete
MKKLLLILICLFVSFEVKSKDFTTESVLKDIKQPRYKNIIESYIIGVYSTIINLNDMDEFKEKLCIPDTIKGSLTPDFIVKMTEDYISKDLNSDMLLNYMFPLTLIVVLNNNFPCSDNWKTR